MNIASGLRGPLVAKAQTILMLVTDGFTNITKLGSQTRTQTLFRLKSVHVYF